MQAPAQQGSPVANRIVLQDIADTVTLNGDIINPKDLR